MLPTSRALKVQARAAMSDSHPSFWVVTLVYLLLVSILPALVYEVFDASLLSIVMDTISNPSSLNASMLDAALISLFVTLVVSLVSVILQFSYNLWSLRSWRREEENGVGSLFEGFGMVGRVLLSNIFVAFFMLWWSMLLITAVSTVVGPLFFGTPSLLTYILIPLYVISVFTASYLIVLRYALVPFVLIDHPELSVFRVVSVAVAMMRRNLWRLFRLNLSFLPWYLLSFGVSSGLSLLVLHLTGQLIPNLNDPQLIITLASQPLPYWLSLVGSLVVSLFLTPYVSVATAGFYDTLVSPPQPATPYDNNIY